MPATSEETTAERLWDFTRKYVVNVGQAYLSFVGPLMLILVAGAALGAQDKEDFGLRWLRCASIDTDREREEKFPQHEPTTAAQRRRNEAAKAAEYAVESA
ncbi:hypothetical protein STCU_11801 [Strigomonas culicis]|uniref:Archaic translocase of outer membrane 12 kDa subunit n=1 Tax=Strigomonas culicis TaxID=28005 RepID=S9TFL1_9TRYP|nr:hypothetical protein STCU_11801 [Strigomonas culicis]|eukprot:EPY15734.1 hypothetical protein STCU_11801 [Strigomonas culicis]